MSGCAFLMGCCFPYGGVVSGCCSTVVGLGIGHSIGVNSLIAT